jgi:hypothetical protein
VKISVILGLVLACGLPGGALAASHGAVIADPLDQPCYTHSFCTPDIASASASYDSTAGSVQVTVTFNSPVPGQEDPGVPGYEVKVALASSTTNGHCGNITSRDISSGLAQGDVLLRGFVAGEVANPQWAQGDLQIGGVAKRLEIARVLSPDGRTLEYGFQSPKLGGNAFWCFEVSENLVTNESMVDDATQFVTFAGIQPAPNLSGIAATHVTSAGAQIDATIDPDGAPASAHVEFGATAKYGSRTPESSALSVPGPVTVPVNGLRPGTTYHYRVVAMSSSGTSSSPDLTFVTRGGTRLTLALAGSLARNSLARCSPTRALEQPTFHWLRGSALIAGASRSTYRITASDSGRLIRCRVSFTAADGKASTLTSAARRSLG